MSALGEIIKAEVGKHREARVAHLASLPEWKFCIVFSDGLYSEPCAGCTFEGVYYDEKEIYDAYMKRNPDADPLF